MKYPHYREYDKTEIELAKWGKAMGHPARVSIVRLLLAGEGATFGEVAEHLPLTAATISEHLRILREVGIVSGSSDGLSVVYRVNRRLLKSVGNRFVKVREPDSAVRRKIDERIKKRAVDYPAGRGASAILGGTRVRATS